MAKGKFASEADEGIHSLANDYLNSNEWVGADQFGLIAGILYVETDDAERVGADAGWYMVSEDSQGFVDVSYFGEDGDDAARTSLATIEAEFQDWCREEDGVA